MLYQKADIEEFKVDPNNFARDHDTVIRGGQANITFMKERATNKRVVLKQSRESLRKKKIEKLFNQEVEVLASVHHPAIVKFIGWAKTSNNRGNIYLELAEKGSLADVIESSQKGHPDPQWDTTHKFIISYGVAIAMRYLHSLNIIHRDLKCENILLDNDLNPLITDFGTSRATTDDLQVSMTVQQTTTQIMPPEFINDFEKYNRTLPIDVYSYAIVLYCLWTEEDPYPNSSAIQIIKKVMAQERPNINESVPENWRKLITECWNDDPEKRPTFSKICERLESPEFVTNEIDIPLFNNYKEKVNL